MQEHFDSIDDKEFLELHRLAECNGEGPTIEEYLSENKIHWSNEEVQVISDEIEKQLITIELKIKNNHE